MKNNFDLRKFLTENKNITEDKRQDAIEELEVLLKDLEIKSDEARSIVRDIDPNEEKILDGIQAFNFGFSSNPYDRTLRKFYEELTGESMNEGEDLDEENSGDYGWFYKFRRMIPGTKEWQETLDSLTKGTPLDKPYSRKGVKKK